VFLESHQLPVVGILLELESGFSRKRDHRIVGPQRVPEQSLRAEGGGTAFEIGQQRFTETTPLPAVVDRQAELKTFRLGMEGIAGFPDDSFKSIDIDGGNNAEWTRVTEVDEVIEFGVRKLADRPEKSIVAGARGERTEVVLQLRCITRLDKTYRRRLTDTRSQHVGVLFEIIETQRDHDTLLSISNPPLRELQRDRTPTRRNRSRY
jgi:hypothetical protein